MRVRTRFCVSVIVGVRVKVERQKLGERMKDKRREQRIADTVNGRGERKRDRK